MVTIHYLSLDSLPSKLGGASEMTACCSSELTGRRMVAVGRRDLSSTVTQKAIEEMVKMERRLFPKHESIAANFHHELRKHNAGLLYCCAADGHVAGYVMYSFPSSSSPPAPSSQILLASFLFFLISSFFPMRLLFFLFTERGVWQFHFMSNCYLSSLLLCFFYSQIWRLFVWIQWLRVKGGKATEKL